MLCTPETPAIISDAGNGPIQHIDRRKKMAAGRNAFNQSLVQPAQRLHREFKNIDKSASKLVIRPIESARRMRGLRRLGPDEVQLRRRRPTYNPKDDKKNLSLREYLAEHAPEQLKQLKFGVHPLGQVWIRIAWFSRFRRSLEIEIPRRRSRSPRHFHFYAEASLDRQALETRHRQRCLLDQQPSGRRFR